MSSADNTVGFLGNFNASFLMAITPEYRKIKAARTPGLSHRRRDKHSFTIQPEYATVDGLKIRYADNKKENLPTLLLLSPLPQSIVCYDLVWEELSKRFRLVALDLPGFGRSEGGVEYMNFTAQSDFLDKFIKFMGLSNLHILGPDVGMPVALHYVLYRHNDVASLLLGDGPAILPSSNGSVIDRMIDSAFWRMVFTITDNEAFVEGAYRLATVNYAPSNEEIADYLASYKGRIGTITQWFKAYPENLAMLSPKLESLQIPTQLFWGDLDQFLLVDNGKRLDRMLPRSRLEVFNNCGHFSYQDKPDQFADMVVRWVQGGFQAV